MTIYAGVDGGQSSTVAVIGDERGRILARASGLPSDLVGEPAGSSRRARVVDAVLAEARAQARLSGDVPFAATVCGFSGYDGHEPPAPAPQSRTNRLRVVHDSEIAHAGALGGAPGIIVIAGTGSAALGIDETGKRAMVGGWGYLFGDEGSAFWVARWSLSRAMEAEDEASANDLRDLALTHFGLPSLRAVQHAFATGELSRARLASLAPVVLDSAQGAPIRRAAVSALGTLAVRAHDRLSTAPARRVSYAGGLFAHGRLVPMLRLRLARHGLWLAPPQHDPAIGALLLAYREAGLDVSIGEPPER